MRVPPWSEALAPRSRELVAAIETRRGGSLLNLDRMLLWSEPLARGWNGYLRAVRTELSLSPFLRELAICVVARLTGALYEYHHHAPELAQAGASPAQLAALDDPDAAAAGSDFDELQRAVIRYASASTRTVAIPEEDFRCAEALARADRTGRTRGRHGYLQHGRAVPRGPRSRSGALIRRRWRPISPAITVAATCSRV